MEAYSVLMSVYAREQPDFLEQAVQSMLRQSAPTDDFVLVCDGPLTEGLERTIQGLCAQCPGVFRILRLPVNQGLGSALREGLPLCRHELVARMDSDDLAVPERAAMQLAAFEADPGVCAVGGQITEFAFDPEKPVSRRSVPLESGDVRRAMRVRNPMNHMTVMFRKSAVLAAGSYMDMPGFEDYYLWARLAARGGRLMNVPQVLVNARVGNNMYARRGGRTYFKVFVRLEKELRRLGVASWPECAAMCLVRLFSSVLLPPKARGAFYRRFLRGGAREGAA